jgi:hypothetical protein
MLTAYFDESGTLGSDKRATLVTEGFVPNHGPIKTKRINPKDSRSIVVACYVADVTDWDAFEIEWKALGKREGVQYYHRTDQETFHKQFENWNRERQVASYKAQHAIIRRRTLAGFGCSVVKADYDDVFQGAARLTMGDAYCFCIRHLLNLLFIWRYHIGRSSEPIYCVFESGALVGAK